MIIEAKNAKEIVAEKDYLINPITRRVGDHRLLNVLTSYALHIKGLLPERREYDRVKNPECCTIPENSKSAVIFCVHGLLLKNYEYEVDPEKDGWNNAIETVRSIIERDILQMGNQNGV